MIKRLLQRLFRWLWPAKTEPENPNLFWVRRVVDEPKTIEERLVYVVGEPGHEWEAILLCPCGCGDVIKLNLLRFEKRPTWHVVANSGNKATLIPSVWRKTGCLSHFIVSEGEIRWCP